MASGYIVEQISTPSTVNPVVIDYKILYYADGLTMPRDGGIYLFVASDKYDFPIITSGLDIPIIIENDLPKIEHYKNLKLEKTALINEIKTFDFQAASQIPLIKILRKIGRLRQIETLLSEF